MEENTNKNGSRTMGCIIIIGFIILCYLLLFNKSESWSLLICESKLSNSECQDIAYEIPGYENQRSCMEAGLTKSDGTGFECGLNCEVKGSGLYVCKK